MKNTIRKTIAVLGIVALSSPAWAGGGNSTYYDYAHVERVKPITEYVDVGKPREVCWTEHVSKRRHYRGGSATPEIIGGIVGGLVGNQIGSGRGKDIATVAGAILGGSIAHDVKRHRRHGYHSYTKPIERCEIRHDYHQEERVVGYRVKYRYNGKLYTTRMDRHPGSTVKVRVNVAVAY